ncbi:hypothetical protein D3C85_1938860 [compost metagenome]
MPLISASSTRIAPPLISSRPAMQFISVDFPHPDGPTRIRNSPESIWISIFFRVSARPLP